MKPALITGMTALALLAGCATAPAGPRVAALPGTGKSSEQFRYDDNQCRQFAYNRINPNAANNAGVRDAVIGTAIGAAAGAAFGGHNGAAVGAGTGLIAGSMVGASESQYIGYDTQQQYDNAYLQCMYGSGHKVPVAAGSTLQQAPASTPRAAPPPPPPPGWRG
jgi:uncharacterized protein YcfJ